jgi:hypothetical protein
MPKRRPTARSVLRDYRSLGPAAQQAVVVALSRAGQVPASRALDHLIAACASLIRSRRGLQRAVRLLADELDRRDPKPRHVERDAEIRRLRREDRRHWTLKRLARKFNTTAEAVRKVCKRG